MAALVYWPAGVTQKMEGDYREQPQRTVDEWQPEHGPALKSLATFVPTTLIQGTICCSTVAEYETLRAFYEDALAMGVLHFIREHPRRRFDAEFAFESFELSQVVFQGVYLSGVVAARHYVAVTLRYFPAVS